MLNGPENAGASCAGEMLAAAGSPTSNGQLKCNWREWNCSTDNSKGKCSNGESSDRESETRSGKDVTD